MSHLSFSADEDEPVAKSLTFNSGDDCATPDGKVEFSRKRNQANGRVNIPFDSSFKALSKVFWIQLDWSERLAGNSTENRGAVVRNVAGSSQFGANLRPTASLDGVAAKR